MRVLGQYKQRGGLSLHFCCVSCRCGKCGGWQIPRRHGPDVNPIYTAQTTSLDDSACGRIHQELLSHGISLPLQDHPDWRKLFVTDRGHMVILRDAAGKPAFAFSVGLSRSRALPGHWLMRVQHYGATNSAAVASVGVAALAQLAIRQKNLLRAQLEVFSANQEVRKGIGQSASSLGFSRSQPPSTGYAKTLALNLAKSEEDLFLGFSRSARRNIRAPAKKGLEIRLITSAMYAERMSALLQETFARTGGSRQFHDWRKRIEFSNAHPGLSRITGCFPKGCDEPASLLSFAWGCNHGDHVTHTSAASTRQPGSNLPLSYAIAWDMILWAQKNGAKWFDFGGITPGSFGTGDGLGGVSDFKRFFSSNVINVGEEWTLEPSKFKGRVSQLIGNTARWIERLSPGK